MISNKNQTIEEETSMFKVFEQPREIRSLFSVQSEYMGQGYIMINIITGPNNTITGELYAICGDSDADMEKYNKLIAQLVQQGDEILVGDTFNADIMVEE